MWSQLVILPWLVCAGGVLQLPPPGTTAWTDATSAAAEPYVATVTPPRASWLLVEVTAPGAFADLDLTVRGSGWEMHGASHVGDETLLLPVLEGETLRVEVSPVSGQASFRIGVTALLASARLTGGQKVALGPADVRLVRVDRPRQQPLSLSCSPGHRAELLLFDERMDLIQRAQAQGEAELLNPVPLAKECLAVVRGSGTVSLSNKEVVEESPLRSFLDRLGKTGAQKLVLATLRRNRDFQRICSYLESYPGGLPLRMLVVPGLKAHGIERFGTYSRGTLAINPTIAGHQTNPQELVDTLIHELVHAILSLPRAEHYPLAPDVLDSSHDPRLQGLGGAPLKREGHEGDYAEYLERFYGPSASNPDEDYTDINAGAQRLIMKVIRHNLRRTGLGKQTLVFKNDNLRRSMRPVAETK